MGADSKKWAQAANIPVQSRTFPRRLTSQISCCLCWLNPQPSCLCTHRAYLCFQSIKARSQPVPQSRACWTYQPHLYSIFLFNKIWLYGPVPTLPLLYNSCNPHIPVIHWTLHQADTSVVKEQAKMGWDVCSEAAGDGGSSWHPLSAATSPHSLKKQNLHHDALSVRRLIYSTCY